MARSNDYVCNLTEASLEKAKRELGENPSERLGQVETFRQWILQQPHIKCPTDTKFLLKFLRHAKFSQLKARQTLEGFLTVKTETPEWLENIDLADPALWEFLDTGYYVIIPGYTERGTKLNLFKTGTIDKIYKKPEWHKKEKKDLIFKAIIGLWIWMLEDENVQVNGIDYFQDFTGLIMGHISYWGMDNVKRSMNIWQNNFPSRFKSVHYYNTGSMFDAFMAIIKPLMNKKLQSRLHIHGDNMENVYNTFGMKMMPDEYLPDDYDGPSFGTSEEIVAKMKEIVTSPEVRDRVLYETSPEWRIDLSKKPSDVPTESFRKLNVD